MKRIGIISAMWCEVELLHNQMDKIETYEYCGMKYFKGQIYDVEVVLSTCGIGKVNAAIFTQLMIDKFHVDAILHTGIAGSMDRKVTHLSLVVADGLTYYDVRKEQLIHCFPNQEIFKTSEELVKLIMSVVDDDTHVGMIITGDDFIADKEKKELLKSQYPEALCVEMEGAAVANTSFVNGVPFAVIRCISDFADGSATEDYKEFEGKAANKASEVVLKVLRNL